MLDGANVAYFGLGSINYHQVQLMLDALEKMGESPLGKLVLVCEVSFLFETVNN